MYLYNPKMISKNLIPFLILHISERAQLKQMKNIIGD